MIDKNSMLKKNIPTFLLLIICIVNGLGLYAQTDAGMIGKLLFADDFKLDNNNWMAEFEKPVGSSIKIGEGKLDLNTAVGATVWYKNKMSGNMMITYTATVVDAGGINDRVSDLNTFWMATNPLNENIFNQNGKFSSYDKLHLYYAGIGGHDNSTTRFRKYAADQGKEILKEYTDKEHLLVGNKKYSITIKLYNGLVQYFINDNLFWEYKDLSPYQEGYFGFRTTTSHQVYEDFKVLQLN